MAKIDTEKFIVSMIQQLKDGHPLRVNILYALLNQGLIYTGDSIVRVVNKKEGPSLEEAITEPVVKRVTQILKESEDERIVKDIICYLQVASQYVPQFRKEELIAWLEKQGEQILANSVKTCKDEQKPAWSEEDNIILSRIIADYERSNEEWFNAQKSLPHGRKITWLKSLKDRVQPKQEWGEEDNIMAQPKQEWSEKDEEYFDDIVRTLRSFVITGGSEAKRYTEEEINWLKSLRPQNKWKPSDEQMEALKGVQEGVFRLGILESLYQDLKKLKEG